MKKYKSRADRLSDAALDLLSVLEQYEFQEEDVSRAIEKFRQIIYTRPGQPRSDLPAQEMKKMRGQGYSLGKIAIHFGCSKDTVRRRLSESTPDATTQEDEESIEPLNPLAYNNPAPPVN